jgi:hypothetical protein
MYIVPAAANFSQGHSTNRYSADYPFVGGQKSMDSSECVATPREDGWRAAKRHRQASPKSPVTISAEPPHE